MFCKIFSDDQEMATNQKIGLCDYLRTEWIDLHNASFALAPKVLEDLDWHISTSIIKCVLGRATLRLRKPKRRACGQVTRRTSIQLNLSRIIYQGVGGWENLVRGVPRTLASGGVVVAVPLVS